MKASEATVRTEHFPQGKTCLSAEAGQRLLALSTSLGRRRLWVLEQKASDDWIYGNYNQLRILGSLDAQLVRESLSRLHTVFPPARTASTNPDQQNHQHDVELQAVELQIVDLSAVDPSEREARLQDVLPQSGLNGFGKVQALLIRLGPEEHLLRLIKDGTKAGSDAEFPWNRVGEIYENLVCPAEPAASAWVGEWLNSETEEDQIAYWTKQLGALMRALDLPVDRPRGQRQKFHRELHTFVLTPDICEDLVSMSKRQESTLFVTYLAAFKTLLHRMTGNADIAVASIDSRFHKGRAAVVSRLLPLQSNLAGDPKFDEVLSQVREQAMSANRHAPLERFTEKLKQQAGLEWATLFKVAFVFQNSFPNAAGSNGNFTRSTMQASLPGTDLATFELKLSLMQTESSERMESAIEYDADLFDPATIASMAKSFQALLRQIIQNPGTRLSQFSLLAEEKEAATWSGTPSGHIGKETVGNMVVAWASQIPRAPALIFDGVELSYSELNNKANRIARRLQEMGTEAGTNVAVLLERSVDQVIAALGILKSGAVLVPLDPAEPSSRLTLILEDAKPEFAITSRNFRERLISYIPEARCLTLEKVEANEIEHEAPCTAKGEDVACLLYRSSPSGGPRAIAVAHHALSAPGIAAAQERVALAVNFSHDLSCFEIFRTLASGACIVNIPSQPAIGPRKLSGLMREHSVAVLWCTAALLERLAREFPRALTNVRRILCDDDRWSALQHLKGSLSPEIVKKVYAISGCTEGGGVCVLHSLAGLDGRPGALPVDEIAEAVSVYVLDSQLQPVANGILGEVFVSGRVSPGYWHDASRTAKDFVADPRQKGLRLYRTGDMARKVGGYIEFRGRQDGRTVIHGLRIEPLEIETILLQCPGVQESAVIVRTLPQTEMVAFIVTQEGQVIARQVQQFIQERMPQGLPALSVVPIAAIPRAADGSVDRMALEQLGTSTAITGGSVPDYVAPGNAVEKSLAEIWTHIFRTERIGIHENFFRRGGNSLLATQTAARISEEFRIDLPLRRLFDAPTIAELARVVQQLASAGEV